MGKHAYCIMAHADNYCLKTLLDLIDDSRNDIFLLIDRKAPDSLTDGINTRKSELYTFPEENRIDIRWGGLSQVMAELLLFEKAIEKDNYDFLHLISGADLPLKSQNQIHYFFDSLPPGSNIVNFSHGKAIEENVDFKTRYWHPYIENQRIRKDKNIIHFLFDYYAKTIRKISVFGQRILNIRRDWKDFNLKKGSQWVSISSDFARYLVDEKDFILKKFNKIICPDEIFLHTMLYNSQFKDTIWDYNGEKEISTRQIDWNRGKPYIWRRTDFPELKNSKELFARKFSSVIDKEIIDLIKNDILNQDSTLNNKQS